MNPILKNGLIATTAAVASFGAMEQIHLPEPNTNDAFVATVQHKLLDDFETLEIVASALAGVGAVGVAWAVKQSRKTLQ